MTSSSLKQLWHSAGSITVSLLRHRKLRQAATKSPVGGEEEKIHGRADSVVSHLEKNKEQKKSKEKKELKEQTEEKNKVAPKAFPCNELN